MPNITHMYNIEKWYVLNIYIFSQDTKIWTFLVWQDVQDTLNKPIKGSHKIHNINNFPREIEPPKLGVG
jgi:hypothetical protein